MVTPGSDTAVIGRDQHHSGEDRPLHGDLMPIVFVTNYLTPNQTSLFSRRADVIITYSQIEARRKWGPLKAEAQMKDVSLLRLRKRLREISCELNNSHDGALIGGSVRSPEFWFSIVLCRLRRTPFAIWMERPRVPVSRLRRTALRLALGKKGGILAVGTTATILYRYLIRGVKVRNFPYSYGRNAPHGAGLDVRMNSTGHWRTTALFIGIEWERKGFDILLTAVAAMPRELQSRLALRVAGLKELPLELRGIVALAANVTYLGYLEPHDVRKELSSADVLVVPSRYDGWAVVVEEAMAEGTPVIASDEVGATADLVVDGYSGFAFKSGDSQALTAALIAVTCHDVSDRSLNVGAMAIVAQHRDKYNIESLEKAICGDLELGGPSRGERPRSISLTSLASNHRKPFGRADEVRYWSRVFRAVRT
jgi:glycosyltransferase involved in cell wall biosynthesis